MDQNNNNNLSVETVLNKAAGFSEFNLEDRTEEYVNQRNKNILKLEIDDIKKRIASRNRYGIALVVLLYIQNACVFALVTLALLSNRLESLQLVFATLITGTLGETFFTVNIIIKWLFRDIAYKIQKNGENESEKK